MCVYIMDKQRPVNFYHACTLLHQYCQLYDSKDEPCDWNQPPDSTEAHLGAILQKLNVILQEKQIHNVGPVSRLAIKVLNLPDYQGYIHVVEAHGYVYDILDFIMYIDRHLFDLPDEFWANKDDVNMREYNPFQSPRAESGVTRLLEISCHVFIKYVPVSPPVLSKSHVFENADGRLLYTFRTSSASRSSVFPTLVYITRGLGTRSPSALTAKPRASSSTS
jgi:hypothetical protein